MLTNNFQVPFNKQVKTEASWHALNEKIGPRRNTCRSLPTHLCFNNIQCGCVDRWSINQYLCLRWNSANNFHVVCVYLQELAGHVFRCGSLIKSIIPGGPMGCCQKNNFIFCVLRIKIAGLLLMSPMMGYGRSRSYLAYEFSRNTYTCHTRSLRCLYVHTVMHLAIRTSGPDESIFFPTVWVYGSMCHDR